MRKIPSTDKKKINSKKAAKKSKKISDKKIFSFNTIILSVLIFIALISLYIVVPKN